MYRCILLLSLLIGLGSMPGVAKAQTSNIERLYEQGKNLLEQSDYDGALRSFKTALQGADGRAGITWQMVLAIAVTYRELDKPAFAIEYFRRFLSLTDAHKDITTQKWRDRRERVAQDLSELERALSYGVGGLLLRVLGRRLLGLALELTRL